MGDEPLRPPIVPKLKNPPPRPNSELQSPMVIDFKADEKKLPSLAVRYLISCLIVCLYFGAIAGFSILCTFQPVIGVGLLFFFIVLGASYALAINEFWERE